MKKTPQSTSEGQAFRRLDFLKFAMDACGAKQRDVATILGRTPSDISYMMTKYDDARFEECDRILRALGYEVQYYYAEKNGNTQYVIKDSDFIGADDGSFRLNKLTFVNCALRAKGVQKKQLAEMLGIHISTLMVYFSQESCFMSVLYRIGEALDLDLVVRLKRADDSLCRKEKARGGHLIVEIEQRIEEPYIGGGKRRQKKD